MLTDEDAVERVRAGDVNAFEHVMRRHNQRIYRAVRAILRDHDETEDVMQEAYVNAFAHLGEFEGRAAFSTWLTRIAVHEAFGRIRKRRPNEPLDTETEPRMSTPPSWTPEALASDGEIRSILEDTILALPENFRTVFILRVVEELSVAESAAVLDIPEETVKTRLHRARGLLRDGIAERIGVAFPGVMTFQRPRCDRVVNNVLGRIGVRQ